jgi:membrane protease YdiL (CAAX protease family)
MRKYGIWVQAVIFGLAHASYGTVIQIVAPFLLGLLFGVVAKRQGLWAAIVAHFLVDMVALGAALLAPESA